MKLMGGQYMKDIYILCRCKIGKIVMYYTLRPNFTPKCPAYYTLIVKRVNRSVSGLKNLMVYVDVILNLLLQNQWANFNQTWHIAS